MINNKKVLENINSINILRVCLKIKININKDK